MQFQRHAEFIITVVLTSRPLILSRVTYLNVIAVEPASPVTFVVFPTGLI